MAKKGKYPAMTLPHRTEQSYERAVTTLVEVVEMLIGRRGNKMQSVATFQDLVDLGIVDADTVDQHLKKRS